MAVKFTKAAENAIRAICRKEIDSMLSDLKKEIKAIQDALEKCRRKGGRPIE